MDSPKITQAQIIQLLDPLFEHIRVDPQDVSRIMFTASDLFIERQTRDGKVTNKIPYSEEN